MTSIDTPFNRVDCLALVDDDKAVVVLGNRSKKPMMVTKYDIATGRKLDSAQVQGATGLTGIVLGGKPCVAISCGYVFGNLSIVIIASAKS